jgi:hypothetical protein
MTMNKGQIETKEVTGYWKFVEAENLYDDFIGKEYYKNMTKEKLMNSLGINSLKGLTIPVYEEIEGMDDMISNLSLPVIEVVNGKAILITVRKFFLGLEFTSKDIDEVFQFGFKHRIRK